MRARAGLVAAFFVSTAYAKRQGRGAGLCRIPPGPGPRRRRPAHSRGREDAGRGRKGARSLRASLSDTRSRSKAPGEATGRFSRPGSRPSRTEWRCSNRTCSPPPTRSSVVWVQAGAMYSEGPRGRKETVGEIVEEGPDVERVRSIMARLVPPYVKTSDLRVRVVDTEEWNAAAMGNGAIWVYRGLLEDLSDDELAIILGTRARPLHPRALAARGEEARCGDSSPASRAWSARGASTTARAAKRRTWALSFPSRPGRAATAATSKIRRTASVSATRTRAASTSRPLPDSGRNSARSTARTTPASNFLFGSHSTPSDRIRNVEREIQL